MAALAIAAIGLAIGAASAVGNYSAQQGQAAAQQQALAAQAAAERERKKQMDLEAARRRRAIIRQSVAARSTALAVSTNQGASLGSGLPGSYGGIAGQSGVNALGVNQNQQIGSKIFDFNAASSSAYRDAAAYGTQANMFSGLSSLGGALIQSSGTFAKVGTYFSTPSAPTYVTGAAGDMAVPTYG